MNNLSTWSPALAAAELGSATFILRRCDFAVVTEMIVDLGVASSSKTLDNYSKSEEFAGNTKMTVSWPTSKAPN